MPFSYPRSPRNCRAFNYDARFFLPSAAGIADMADRRKVFTASDD